jgi:hypothetical protein
VIIFAPQGDGTSPRKGRTKVNTPNLERKEFQHRIFDCRREFLKRALLTSAYVAPIVMSFAAGDLARASACPGGGYCGKSEWAHTM